MTKEEFLELFSEKNRYWYGYRYIPLNENHFSIAYRASADEFSINYQRSFEDYDGYTTETADDNLKITFEIALKIYKLDSSLEGC